MIRIKLSPDELKAVQAIDDFILGRVTTEADQASSRRSRLLEHLKNPGFTHRQPYPILLNQQQYEDFQGLPDSEHSGHQMSAFPEPPRVFQNEWGHAQHPPEIFGSDPWGLK